MPEPARKDIPRSIDSKQQRAELAADDNYEHPTLADTLKTIDRILDDLTAEIAAVRGRANRIAVDQLKLGASA